MTQMVLEAALLMVSVVSLVTGDCSLVETRVMQAQFSNCSRLVTQNTEDICELLENVVGECGKNWLSCHSEREVRKMRDLHIVHLIRSYEVNNNLDDCLVVKEYRESGRAEGEAEDDVLCDDDTTRKVQEKLQTCSHTISTGVYHDIQELESPKKISAKLCKALSAIGTVCVKDLNQCFATEDLLQMRKSHLEEMKSFLLRISQDKVKKTALDDCKILDYTEDVDNQQVDLDNEVMEVTEVDSDKDDTTTMATTSSTTTTTSTTSTTSTSSTSEREFQVKGSRSAEFVEESENFDSPDNGVDDEIVSTEAAERLHSRTSSLPSSLSSSSRRGRIHSVIILVASLYSCVTLL